jgi:hypothetical protein
MGAKTKGAISQRAMASNAGVTVRTLQNWEKEGIDITDESAVRERAARMEKRGGDVEDYNAARLRKLSAEADLKEHELEVERGRYVSQESQRADGQKLGLVLQGMMLKMADDLTPILAGRPAGEVKKAIQKYAREKLTELSQYAPDTLP